MGRCWRRLDLRKLTVLKLTAPLLAKIDLDPSGRERFNARLNFHPEFPVLWPRLFLFK
jgi:hypothetical protein